MSPKQYRNWKALDDFGIHWQAAGLIEWHHHSLVVVRCHLRYHMRGEVRRATTEVHLHHDGKIYLVDADWLNSTDHYVEFSTDWQTYSLKRDGVLRVEGRGEKVGGEYRVEIVPASRT